MSKQMSRLMGKSTICIGENKDADQLRGNREADQRLCFRYSDSTIPHLLYPKLQASSSFLCLYRPVCVGPVRKPRWFSHEAAQMLTPSNYDVLCVLCADSYVNLYRFSIFYVRCYRFSMGTL